MNFENEKTPIGVREKSSLRIVPTVQENTQLILEAKGMARKLLTCISGEVDKENESFSPSCMGAELQLQNAELKSLLGMLQLIENIMC